MFNVGIDEPGRSLLLMGNEAIARGAIEAGVDFCAGYPGTPSSEILGTLAKAAERLGFYAEWSTNEIVAIEAAGAASFAGLRALTAMKQNGLNVASDFLLTVNLSGTGGGFVLVVADDPSAHSSTNEQDSRNFARFADLPLLEPATFQEAKDMTIWAFELSERLKVPCIIRSITRFSHGRGNVKLGPIPKRERKASFSGMFITVPTLMWHSTLHQKLESAREEFETSGFNWYVGPEQAKFIIITCGSGWFYSQEAVKALGMEEEVGILKLGTTWPLPEKLVASHLKHAPEVLIVEEVDPFLEQNVKILTAELAKDLGPIKFYGKSSKHIPDIGEISPDTVIQALARIKGVDYRPRDEGYHDEVKKVVGTYAPFRMLSFCAGCPHRPAFWAIKSALKLDGRDGVVTGDIGCYSLGVGPAGYFQSKTLHCMGAGLGIATGLGNLQQFGFNQPVIAISGDSTFYHACIPALINARYNRANITYVILDNSATAMTGFQPHPGTGVDARGQAVPSVSIEGICRAIGAEVRICDPFAFDEAVENLYELFQSEGIGVMIFRRKCTTLELKEKKKPKVYVDPEKCIGDDCGCARFCSRVFNCPGIIWDPEAKKAKIDELVCSGCGICAEFCSQGAIIVEED